MSDAIAKAPPGDNKGSWWNTIAKHALVTAITILSIVLAAQVWSDPYLINPIDVPEELSKSGLSGTTIAGLMRDRVAVITAKARTVTGSDLKIETKGLGDSQVDVKITGTDLSVRALAAEIANLFGFAPLEITGSIWAARIDWSTDEKEEVIPSDQKQQKLYHISLRDSKGGGVPLFESQGYALDELVSDAAVAILGAIDPARAANFLRFGGSSDRIEALAMAQEGVRRAKLHDNNIWFKFFRWPDSELPRALLVQAYVIASNGFYDDSLKAFDKAQDAYTLAGEAVIGRQYSMDGKAVASLEQVATSISGAGFDHAKDYLNQVGSPKYDSAEFHEVDLLRLKAERRLDREGCAGIVDVEAADVSFDLFEKEYEEFTIAYLLHANMLKNLATFLHFQGNRSKDCIIAGSRHDFIKGLYEKGEKRFRQAIALDDKMADAWLQLGILVYQTQIDEPEWHPEHSGDPNIIDKAIDILGHASRLDPPSPYAYYRVADAIRARLAVTPSAAKNEEYARRGLEAACRGYTISSGQMRSDLAALARNFSSRTPAPCESTSP